MCYNSFVLFRGLDTLFSDPLAFIRLLVATAVALAVAIAVHEASHALAADRLGDPTPRRLGRLTLNPLRHLDPIGTILLFVVGFGWGKPVPVDSFYFRGNPVSGMAKVALAGPLAGLITAGLVSVLLKLVDPTLVDDLGHLLRGRGSFINVLLLYTVLYNIVLAVFNLIPLPPLDGFRILLGILPSPAMVRVARWENYGPSLLIMVVLLDSFAGAGILGRVLGPAVNFFSQLYLGRAIL